MAFLLRVCIEEAEETIHAIQTGGVDGLIVSGPEGDRVFALEGVDYAYRVLVDVMTEGVLTLDTDGGILSCNNRFATFVKLPVEEVLGRNIREFVIRGALHTIRAFLHDPSKRGGRHEHQPRAGGRHGHPGQAFRGRTRDQRSEAALDSGEPDQIAFRVILPKDGLRHLIAHGKMVFDDQGEPVRIAGTLLDITEHNLTNLGNPFFTTKRGFGGTGLGLWVSFKIVREHGGTLDFHSIPEKGTRVELTLPITQEQ